MNLRLKKLGGLLGVIALTTLGLLSFGCASAQEAPRIQGGFGVNDHNIWQTPEQQDVTFTKYAETGTKFVRSGAHWNVMEPEKGTYSQVHLARMDHFFKKASEAGIRVLLTSAYAPAWANGGFKESGRVPLKDEDFADFCEFLVRRYAPYKSADGVRTLEAFEIWNEPDLSDLFFKPYKRFSADGATKYGQMVVAVGGRLQKVRDEIKAKDVLILAPVLADVHSACYYPWMDAFYAVPDVTKYYDVFAWHSYWQSSGTTGWLPPELPAAFSSTNQKQSVMGKLTAPNDGSIWQKMVKHGDDHKPNWLTEIGGAARSDTPEHKPHSLLSLEEQKTHLEEVVDTLYTGKVNNLRRVYWYTFFDGPSQKGDQQVYGMMALTANNPVLYEGRENLLTGKLTPKPAYLAYKAAKKTGEIIPAIAKPSIATTTAALAVPDVAIPIDKSVKPHTGKGLATVSLTGTPGWKQMFQIAGNIEPQKEAEFSFWMKGSGTIRLKITPANWATTLASKEITATPEWTKYTLPNLNSGENTSLVFCFQDSSKTAGVLYIDDCFLGVPGGSNKLFNAGFEDGGNGWNSSPIFDFHHAEG